MTAPRDNDPDITAEFWGTAPGWRPTGSTPKARRRPSATSADARSTPAAGIPRTRSHRTVCDLPARPPVRMFDQEVESSAPVRDDHRDDEVQVEEIVPMLRRPTSRPALGAIDPLFVRLGAIVAIGALLVPVAIALRDDSGGSIGSAAAEADASATSAAVTTTDETRPGTGAADQSGQSDGSTTPNPPTAPSGDSLPEKGDVPTGGETTAVVPSATASIGDPEQPATTEQTGDGEIALAAVGGADCTRTYTVHAGDYWIRLADAAEVSLTALLAVNAATVDTALYPDDEVCLPEGAAIPAPPTTQAPTTTAAPNTTQAPTTAAPTTQAPTTQAPTTQAPATTSPSGPSRGPSNETPAQVRAIIRDVWPDDLQERAITVAGRESSFRPGAYNGHCCYGVFQIHWTAHRSWLANFGVTSSAHLLDARTNIEMAYEIYRRAGGWRPWSQTAY